MKRIVAYKGLELNGWLIINCDDISYIEIETDTEHEILDINNEEVYIQDVIMHLKSGDKFPIYTYPNGYSTLTAEDLIDEIDKLLASEDENEAVYYECL